MSTRKLFMIVAFGIMMFGASSAYCESQQDDKAATESQNISSPGPEGGSCSATSEDGNKTCSISCATGKAAICSNTKTTVSCRCS